MNSKWWFRGSSGPVSCSCQTSVWRLRGAGNGLLRPLLGRPMATAARACAPAHGPVHTGRPSTGFPGVCLRVSPCVVVPRCVCHRRVCPCDRVRVQSFRICDPGPPLNGRPSGVADHRGLLRARWLGEAPCVCMCRYGGRRARGHRERTPRSVARGRHGGTRAGVCVTLGASSLWATVLLSAATAEGCATLRQASPGVLSACEPTPCFTTTRLALGLPSTGGSHPYAPLAPHPCVRRGSERAFGRRVCCPPSSHSSSQEISALCPALRGHGGSREMR